MRRFVEGVDRGQTTLFPERVEDWIGEDNPARVVDVFVKGLIWPSLGLVGSITRQPADLRIIPRSYHPSILLKLYIYGYLNRVQLRRQHYTLQTTQQSVTIQTRRPIVGGRCETY